MNDFNGPGRSQSQGRGRGNRRPWRGPRGGPRGRGARAESQPPPAHGRGAHHRDRSGTGPSGGRPMYYNVTEPHDPYSPEQIVANNSNNHRGQNDRKDESSNRRHRNNRDRPMGFKILEEISQSDSADIIQKINHHKQLFANLLDTPVDKKKNDVFALMMDLMKNVWKSSFEESKKLILLDLCNSKFLDHLQLYLMHLPYSDKQDKYFNKYYWTKEKEFWENFMTFCECIINVSPSTAVRKCGSLIEATTKSCLEGLKDRHHFELPEDYATRMTRIRDSLKTCDEEQAQKKKINVNETDGPKENFRELSILPTPDELVNRRPYLRPNVVDGGYEDKEHYLDVQFRLLREDCFGPLREGIHQFIEEPKRKKFDHIRVYRNTKFLEPFVSKQKIGSTVLLDEETMKRFKRVNWAHSKRFLFGSLVLFTKDNCKNFLIGTILERDETYLSKGQVPVNIVNVAVEYNLYNDDSYTMIESEVYFEPYYHVLKALQDPNFPQHIAMSNYIVNVQKIPEVPAYLNPDTTFKVKTVDLTKVQFTVLKEETWPTEKMLGLNSTQYEAYKLALTHEFAVIQGPPGTGKTFLGVKIAETLLKNAPFALNGCRMLVICYTNHALDQFLEALLPVTQSMARIGGRSKNEAMENININKLRRKANSSYFHARRINLKLEISALEYAQERVDTLYSSVLSYQTVVAVAEECKVIQNYYKGSGIQDPLKHWLFEDIDNIEFEPLLEQNVEIEEELVTEDADIFNRDDVVFDDLDDDDVHIEKHRFDNIKTSFSLSETEEEIKKLLIRFQIIRDAHHPLHKQRELQDEIGHLCSQVKLFQEMQQYRSRAPSIRLTHVQDITAISRIERWVLYFKWSELAMTDAKKVIKDLQKKLQSTAELYDEARMMVDLAIVKETQVVGMTTSGAARLRKLLAEMAPTIVIVEEAAEVLEAHIVTSLTRSCQHLILIGDHQQLRPSAAYMRLARDYNIEVSLFERMILNDVHSRRLGVQHRMRPEIAALVSPHIYPELRNHPSVEGFPPVRGVAHNLFFFTHENPEQCEDDSSSRKNTYEGDMVLRLANYLMQQDYKPEDVTILAAYSGQMFYLRKQRPLYAHLSNIKITVLDNYQGEESKIILLSLVRNNANDSIGFLATENRICVALSRAREGFFIFGNIEMLKRKSTLWTNIAKTLADNGSLGRSLILKCSNHVGQITTIEKVDDFVKVPEGGCLVDCKYNLPCGHACPRVCHIYDLVHAKIQCTKDCERKICEIENHKCPLRCAVPCKPCKLPVEKYLPCGHSMVIPCHKEPGDPSIHCTVVVTVTLPDCGHEAKKACSMKISEVRCTEKCPNSRLACGHACRRKCHVTDDPEHERLPTLSVFSDDELHSVTPSSIGALLGDFIICPSSSKPVSSEPPTSPQALSSRADQTSTLILQRQTARPSANGNIHNSEYYTCLRPCPKAKRGCTANLEDDLGEHKCLRSCFEECVDCNVQVVKKRSGCRHSKRVACHENPDETPCRQKCARSLPCSHHCKKLCFEQCGDCQQKAKKIVPDCLHEIEIACGKTPTRADCKRKCERIKSCGHVCTGRCDRPCDETKCNELMDRKFDSPCGHKVKIPCHIYGSMMAGGVKAEVLLSYCTAPCGVLLRCNHACGGTCATCHQGRLHAPCAATCHQLNICGHQCEEPCNQVCPPCKKRCEVKCKHSQCGKQCGAPCQPCSEPDCSRACEHSRCSRPCGAACDRAPCDLPCPKLQACGHPCRGLCGEPCPQACRICDPEHFPTDLLGDPYEDDDRLVQLQDCQHILDIDNLDNLMKSESETIQIKGCPFCRQPIVNTYRYKNIINKLLKNDFNPVKEKVYGSIKQRNLKREKLRKKVLHLETSQRIALANKHWKFAFEKIQIAIQLKDRNTSLLHLEMYHIYLDIVENVGAYYIQYRTNKLNELKTEVEGQVKLICVTLARNKQKISQQQQLDFGNELKRLNSMIQLATIIDNVNYKISKSASNVAQAGEEASEAILSRRTFDEGKAVECLTKLQTLVKLSGIASKEERDMIVRAIGLKAGHWYKCPNGHFYCIGDCGGAMQLAKCPDCGAAIGGQNHALTAGNRHAGELDDSPFAAWSQEAHNMMNYRFD